MHSQSRRVPARPLAAPLQQHQQTSSARVAQRQGHGGSTAPTQNLGGASATGRKTPKSAAASKSNVPSDEDANRAHPSPNAVALIGKGGGASPISTNGGSTSNNIINANNSNNEVASKEYLDYTNTTFPPLEPPSEITFEKVSFASGVSILSSCFYINWRYCDSTADPRPSRIGWCGTNCSLEHIRHRKVIWRHSSCLYPF
jgi:hypothetical protein